MVPVTKPVSPPSLHYTIFLGTWILYMLTSNQGYIGDDIYDPIWSALDTRRAIIFIHGTQTPASTPIPHPTLGLPITEVNPHPNPQLPM
jgi:hypothetical protein